MIKIEQAQKAVKKAKEQLARAEAALEEAKEEVLKPWTPGCDNAYRRYSEVPGSYGTCVAEFVISRNPGYSRTEKQAESRAYLDKVNDLLWGLKMQLEPDWEPDWCDIDQAKYLIIFCHRIRTWVSHWHQYSHIPTTVIFSKNSNLKVVEYLNKRYPDGEIT